jgi:hypothetical protein
MFRCHSERLRRADVLHRIRRSEESHCRTEILRSAVISGIAQNDKRQTHVEL